MTSSSREASLPAPGKIPGVVARTNARTGRTRYEGQIARPRVNGRRPAPLTRTFDTAEEATAWRAAELAKLTDTPADRSSGPLTLDRWTARWIPSTTHLSGSTRRSYESLLRLHVRPTLGQRPLASIKPSDLSALYADVATRKTDQTTRRVAAAVHACLGAAVADGHLDRNPATDARLPKARPVEKQAGRPRETHAWDLATVRRFLDNKQVSNHTLCDLLTVAAFTGLRRSELIGLTPADVTLSGGKPAIKVNRAVVLDQDGNATISTTKTRHGARRIPLTPEAVRAVRRALETATPQTLFVNPKTNARWRGDTITRDFTYLVRAFIKANPAAPRVTLHGLRHSWVTIALESGMPMAIVSKLAGHGDPSFTIKRYGHLLDDHADQAMAAFGG